MKKVSKKETEVNTDPVPTTPPKKPKRPRN